MSSSSELTITQELSPSPEELKSLIPQIDNYQGTPFILSTGKGREGVAYLGKNETDWGPGTYLAHVLVQPAYRRQGLGTRLLNGLLEEAQRLGLSRINAAFSFKVPGRGTPPSEVRFCRKMNAKVIQIIDTFHLGEAQAQSLINRLKKLNERTANLFQWIPASALNPESYEKFVRENVNSVFSSTQVRPPQENEEMAEISIAALLPDQTTIAGIIIPTTSNQLAATLEYQLFAVAPEFRQSPLAAFLLARSIGNALNGPWKNSRFQVKEEQSSAMWRFAKKHATLRGATVNYAFER